MSSFDVNPLSLPTTVPPAQLDSSLASLKEAKISTLNATGQTSLYIKAMVDKNRKLWWDALEEDLVSTDPIVRRTALMEYNKLQCRILPTELTSPEDGGIVVKLMSYATKQAIDDNNQISYPDAIDVVPEPEPEDG